MQAIQVHIAYMHEVITDKEGIINMTYYAFIENNAINGKGQCPQLTEGVTSFEIFSAL